jgi:GDPmannose 4,6-dehydratase
LEFVTRKISHAVARISLGKQETLELGALEPKRDWGFAGDYVEAMWLMLQHGKADDYVVATGENHAVSEFLDLAFKTVGIRNWSQYVISNKTPHMRPAEVDYLIGNATKARKVLGWKPKTSFSQLVEMMVKADLAMEKREK